MTDLIPRASRQNRRFASRLIELREDPTDLDQDSSRRLDEVSGSGASPTCRHSMVPCSPRGLLNQASKDLFESYPSPRRHRHAFALEGPNVWCGGNSSAQMYTSINSSLPFPLPAIAKNI